MRYTIVLLPLFVLACGDAITPNVQVIPLLSIVVGQAQTDTIGKTLPTQISALLTDKISGLPLPGRIVNWVVVAGGGSVFAPVVQTGTDGTAKQVWTLGMTPGLQKLVARWVNPETGEPVTIDTARATALPNWNVTVLINNTYSGLGSGPATFTWFDGGVQKGADVISVGSTRCERILIRSAPGGFHIQSPNATADAPNVDPAATPAYTAVVSNGSILTTAVQSQC